VYIITSLIIGDAVDVQTVLRPSLLSRDICCAKIAEKPFIAKELNWNSSRDELHCSKQGWKCCEWLRVMTGHPVITAVIFG